MKKLIVLGIAFTFFVASASAQSIRNGGKAKSLNGLNDHRITPGEKFKMKKNSVRYHRTARHFKRDGHFSRGERGKLAMMKRHDRKQAFRFKHNAHRRS